MLPCAIYYLVLFSYNMDERVFFSSSAVRRTNRNGNTKMVTLALITYICITVSGLAALKLQNPDLQLDIIYHYVFHSSTMYYGRGGCVHR